MLRFRDRRAITSVDGLTPIERDQLRIAGNRYDGEDLAAEARLVPVTPDEYMEGSFGDSCMLWRVVDQDRLVDLYDAWFYMGDSGTLFRAGTSDDVACIVQGGLQCDDPALRTRLGAGMVEAGLLPRGDLSYDEFAVALARENAGVVIDPIFAEGTLPATPSAKKFEMSPTLRRAVELLEVSRVELAALGREETAPARPRPKRATTVAERPSAKRKTRVKPNKAAKKSPTKKPRSTKKPSRKRKKPATRRR